MPVPLREAQILSQLLNRFLLPIVASKQFNCVFLAVLLNELICFENFGVLRVRNRYDHSVGVLVKPDCAIAV